MKKTFLLTWACLACASTLLLSSCKKDDDQPDAPQPVVDEPEQITTVELHFNFGNDQFVVQWADPDGPGGSDPEIDPIELDSGITYDVEVLFLDESGGTAENLTAEIREEDDEHIICIEPEGGLEEALEVSRTDSDGTHEVGLQSRWLASKKTSGEVQLTLKHQPDGLKDGTCSPGDTDVEVHFDLTVK